MGGFFFFLTTLLVSTTINSLEKRCGWTVMETTSICKIDARAVMGRPSGMVGMRAGMASVSSCGPV